MPKPNGTLVNIDWETLVTCAVAGRVLASDIPLLTRRLLAAGVRIGVRHLAQENTQAGASAMQRRTDTVQSDGGTITGVTITGGTSR